MSLGRIEYICTHCEKKVGEILAFGVVIIRRAKISVWQLLEY